MQRQVHAVWRQREIGQRVEEFLAHTHLQVVNDPNSAVTSSTEKGVSYIDVTRVTRERIQHCRVGIDVTISDHRAIEFQLQEEKRKVEELPTVPPRNCVKSKDRYGKGF